MLNQRSAHLPAGQVLFGKLFTVEKRYIFSTPSIVGVVSFCKGSDFSGWYKWFDLVGSRLGLKHD